MNLLARFREEIEGVIYECRARAGKLKPAVEHDVPYVCQFAKPEHAELSLKKELDPANDPHWKETGALSPERYADWAFTMCGMASTVMALSHMKDKDIRPAELAEDAMKHGVYVNEGEIISGMRYREFVPWVKKFGIRARMYPRMSLRGIQHALSNGGLVIASVNPNIRGYDTAPTVQKGGHLVLVTGYDLKKGTITINNPSGFVSQNTQKGHKLSFQEFNKFYAGRGITLYEE